MESLIKKGNIFMLDDTLYTVFLRDRNGETNYSESSIMKKHELFLCLEHEDLIVCRRDALYAMRLSDCRKCYIYVQSTRENVITLFN